MKSSKCLTPVQAHRLSDDQQSEQVQAEAISEPILKEEEAIRAQFKLEDQMYQRFKLPLYDAFSDLCSK